MGISVRLPLLMLLAVLQAGGQNVKPGVPVVPPPPQDSLANAKEETRARKDMEILLGVKGKKPDPKAAKKKDSKILFDKDEPESPPFAVNTIDAMQRKVPRANGEQFMPVFETYYTLHGNGRVHAAIFRYDTLTKKDSLMRTLLIQNKSKGQHYIYWDGTNERGLRLNGNFECRVDFKHNPEDSMVQDTVIHLPVKAEK
ncbi:MAG: hypothetical protein V1913_06210 [Fibrobacterota bacterium]